MAEESYTSRYRPQEWKEVVGQTQVVKSLKAVIAKRTNHTFLLHGPSGTGKTTLARIAAKEIGCEETDILEINAADFTGVDDMRDIAKSLGRIPLSGRPRSIILDECHRMSAAAFSMILKPLEEPPEWVWWFLCTTDPAKVPDTVKTRATQYQLKAVSKGDLFELLEDIAREEGLEVGDDVIELCVRNANGSPRGAVVNLSACAAARSVDEAKDLLRSTEEVTEAIDLARALVSRSDWNKVREIMVSLKDTNPESIRHTVRAYVTAVILGGKQKNVEKYMAILNEFSQPFYQSDGMSPLVLSCGKLFFGNDD